MLSKILEERESSGPGSSFLSLERAEGRRPLFGTVFLALKHSGPQRAAGSVKAIQPLTARNTPAPGQQ